MSTISGNVGVAAALVSYAGPSSGSVTADGSGNFTIPGLANGTYTLTPSLAKYTFTPTSLQVVISGANVAGPYVTIADTGFVQADGPLTGTQWTNSPAVTSETPNVISHLLQCQTINFGAATYWSANPFPLGGNEWAGVAIHQLAGNDVNDLVEVILLATIATGAGGFGLNIVPDGLGNIVIITFDNNLDLGLGAEFTVPFVADAVARIEFLSGVITTKYNGVTLQSIGGFSAHNADAGPPLLFFQGFDVVTNCQMSHFSAGTVLNFTATPNASDSGFGYDLNFSF